MTTTSDRSLPAPGEPPVHPTPVPPTPVADAAPVADALTGPDAPTSPDAAPVAVPGPGSGAVPERDGADALRRLVRRVHFYAGVLVAPFLAVLCLTGIAYAFTPQLNDLIHTRELLVAPQAAPAAPLDDQIAAARAEAPGLPLTSVKTPTAPDRTTAVLFSPPGAAEGGTLAVYVDPYTAQVTGTLGLNHGEPPAQYWLRTLHGDLHLGTVGGIYSEFAASWLPVLFIGGIVLWIGKRRARRRDLVVPAGGRPGRPRILNWHGSVGIWLTAALVFISLTGLTWSTFAGERFQAVLTGLDARTPAMATTELPVVDGPPITAGAAEAVARGAGFQGPLTLTPPSAPGKPFLVAETTVTVPLHRDRMALDPATGEVVETIRFADHPFLSRLSTIGILAHTGTLFGLANQLALTAMALGILAMLFWGYRMWWQRRPTRGGRPRPLERRGVLRSSPQPVLFGVVLAAVLAGWLMPVFGASLALFLVVDTAAGAMRRRRAAA